MAPEALEQVDAVGREVEQHGIPGIVDLLVTQVQSCQAADLCAKAFGRNRSPVETVEQIVLRSLVKKPVKITNAHILKSIQGGVVVNVVKHPAQIKYDVANGFHSRKKCKNVGGNRVYCVNLQSQNKRQRYAFSGAHSSVG